MKSFSFLKVCADTIIKEIYMYKKWINNLFYRQKIPSFILVENLLKYYTLINFENEIDLK